MLERSIRLYDTKTKSLQSVEPLEKGHLKFYSCGPTVYSYAHIGNFRTFLTADLIVRLATALGMKVTYVSNITDVGHLTQDDLSDALGEDKMEKALRSKEGKSFSSIWELAEYYSEAFKEDWRLLNLLVPTVQPKATHYIREQILAIENLIQKGHAYETGDAVYFDVSSYPNYGELSGNTNQDQLMRGVRDVVQDDRKKHPADFALWKKDDKHLMQWYSPWGWGFPGWHLECSVMGAHLLGDTFDIHGGGEDLIFPHHECESAQSACLTGKPLANYWIHTRFLQVEGEKMSKSKGNFYTVRDLTLKKNVPPLALRYALISVPYNRPLNFTMQGLKDAMSATSRYRECLRIVDEAIRKSLSGEDRLKSDLERLYDEALDAMCSDLNTSVALAKAYEATKCILKESDNLSLASAESAKRALERFNHLLGIVEGESSWIRLKQEEGISEEEINGLIEEREQARRQKNFALSDQIRDQLLEKGIELRDGSEGTTWSRRTL